MKTQLLGSSSLLTTRMAYGCMRISAVEEAAAHHAVNAAFEAGYRLFDHADIYGNGLSETFFGRALRENNDMRRRICIATKCGVRRAGDDGANSPGRYDFSLQHILRSCEGSLSRLGVETIDLYQLHRPDVLMDPDEVAAAFDTLRRQGKVREFGVSNFLPSQVQALQSRLPMRLMVNQVEIHPAHLDCFTNGTLDQCLAGRMTPLAWSPLNRGMFVDGATVPSNHPSYEHLQSLLDVLDELGRELNASRSVIVLSWLMKHPSGIIPIIGSTDPGRIRQAAAADDLQLTREQWYRIYIAARGAKMP